MILLVAVCISLIVALLRGRRLERLVDVSFRFGWLAFVGLGLQMVYAFLPTLASGATRWERMLLFAAAHGLLVPVVALNYRLPGFRLIGLGLILNMVVMVANDGLMPITGASLARAGLGHLAAGIQPGSPISSAKDVLLAREDIRLWILADILVLPPPVRSVFSVGDALLALGAFVFFQRATKVPASEQPDEASSSELGQQEDQGET